MLALDGVTASDWGPVVPPLMMWLSSSIQVSVGAAHSHMWLLYRLSRIGWRPILLLHTRRSGRVLLQRHNDHLHSHNRHHHVRHLNVQPGAF